MSVVVPCLFAEQLAVVPPFNPAQVHAQGPVPVTAEAVPLLHRFVVGAVETVDPSADPHSPLTGVTVPVLYILTKLLADLLVFPAASLAIA